LKLSRRRGAHSWGDSMDLAQLLLSCDGVYTVQ